MIDGQKDVLDGQKDVLAIQKDVLAIQKDVLDGQKDVLDKQKDIDAQKDIDGCKIPKLVASVHKSVNRIDEQQKDIDGCNKGVPVRGIHRVGTPKWAKVYRNRKKLIDAMKDKDECKTPELAAIHKSMGRQKDIDGLKENIK